MVGFASKGVDCPADAPGCVGAGCGVVAACGVVVGVLPAVGAGGLARITELAGEAAWLEPSGLVAVTSTRACLPAEPAGGV